MKKRRIALVLLIIILSFGMVGCEPVNDALVKIGVKNKDFDYMKNNKVSEIVIQSSRDPGFRFIVTDQKAIEDIYNILASGNPKSEKSTLEPDYIFEIHVGDEIKKYNYVVGVDESGRGNFFNNDQAYQVPKDLDQTIINNLSFIRKPRNFYEIYYGSIMKVIDLTKSQYDNGKYKVGVNLIGDIDCVKYLFSVDLQAFKKELQKAVPGAELINNNSSDYDVVINVQNKGFNSDTFKSVITINNKKNDIYETYYVLGKYEFKSWEIKVGEQNKKPEGW